jgi:hypothetical protein
MSHQPDYTQPWTAGDKEAKCRWLMDFTLRFRRRFYIILGDSSFPNLTTMSVPSPRKVGVGMMQNFMSLDSPDSDARSSRIALKDELVGKLVFDDPRVFKRLAVDRISPQFVANCVQAFTTNQDLVDARRELDKITAAAIGKPFEELETDDEVEDSLTKKKG